MDRLAEAMAAYLRYREQGGPLDGFLQQHGELRDLLEPLFDADTATPPEAEDGGTGRVLGGFRILRPLRRGGMGSVFEAVDDQLQRRVALKLLPQHLSLIDTHVERFKREAVLAARLGHPGLCTVLGHGRAGDTHWLAMELLEGEALDQVLMRLHDRDPRELRAQDLSEAQPAARTFVEAVLDLVEQVATALDHAHRHGVIHRDVKPSNLLLRGDGTVVLTDFGLALGEGLPQLTATGDFAGTPYYVSPEQAMSGRVPVDRRTDVFSLGVVLYELLTLHRPFEGETSQQVLALIVGKEPPDPRRYHPELPGTLSAIVLRALEKDPDRRYRTAGELAADLRAFREYRKVKAQRASVLHRLRRFAQREPLKASLALVLAVGIPLVAGLGGYIAATAPVAAEGRRRLERERIELALATVFVDQLGGQALPEQIAGLQDAVSALPEDPELVATLGLVVLRSGSPAEALALLDAHRQVPEPRSLRRLRARVLQKAGREVEARAIDTELGAPREPFELVLASLPEVDTVFVPKERAQASLELAARAMALSPRPYPLYYFTFATVARAAGDPAAQARIAEALEALWPMSFGAWFCAGYALEHADKERAARCYERALGLGGDVDWRTHYRLALLRQALGRRDDAIAGFARSVELRPQHWLGRSMLVYALLAAGDEPRVRAALEDWERAAAGVPRGLSPLAMMLANPATPADLQARSVEVARRAAELEPDHPRYWFTLARQLERTGDETRARQALARARGADARKVTAAELADMDKFEAQLDGKLPPGPANPHGAK